MREKAVFQTGMTCGLTGFLITIYLGGYMGGVLSAPNIHVIHVTIIVWCEELKPTCSRFCYYPCRQLNFVCFTCKTDGEIFLIYSIFYICYFFINIFNWQFFSSCRLWFLDMSQVWRSSFLKLMCKLMTTKNRCNRSWIAELNTFWHVCFQWLILLSYNFLQFDEFIFFL